ncbi:Uncharacterised protein (plasmid) [Klebsiella pneumoniae]|nr:Uncharacterised protein [Klebsiella pneumoniae]
MLIEYAVLVTYLMLPLLCGQLRETVIQHCASEDIPAENNQTVSEPLTQPFSDNILPPQKLW